MCEGFLLITRCGASKCSTRAEHPAALDFFFLFQEQEIPCDGFSVEPDSSVLEMPALLVPLIDSQ